MRWSFWASRIIRSWTIWSMSLGLTHSYASIKSVWRTIQLVSHLSSRDYIAVIWSCRRIPRLSAWISRHWRSLSCTTTVNRRSCLNILRLLIRRTVPRTIRHRCKWLHSILSTSSIKAFHTYIWNIWCKPYWSSSSNVVFFIIYLLVYYTLLFGNCLCYII